MSASTSPVSFGDKLYDYTVKNSISVQFYCKTVSKLAFVNGDTRNIILVKSLGFKASMCSVFGLALVEIVAKTALGLVFLLFSLITWPVASTLSRKSYDFSKDLYITAALAFSAVHVSFKNFIYG